jgi:hypothetical protein
VAAGVVVAANAWAPLVILGAPTVVMAARSLGLPRTRRDLVRLTVVCGLAAAGVLRAAWMLTRSVDVQVIVTAAGAITISSPTPSLMLVVLSGAVFLGAPVVARRLRREQLIAVAPAVKRLWLVTLSGTLSLSTLIVLQLVTIRGLSYYAFKYLVGLELVLAAVTSAATAMCVALLLPGIAAGRRRPTLIASAVLCRRVTTSHWERRAPTHRSFRTCGSRL